MAVRLGTVIEGSPYTVTFEANGGNDGVTFVLIGWMPAGDAQAQTWALRIEPGQSDEHASTAPLAKDYFFIEIEVDLPEPQGAGTLTVEGLVEGTKTVPVTADETYRILIVGK